MLIPRSAVFWKRSRMACRNSSCDFPWSVSAYSITGNHMAYTGALSEGENSVVPVAVSTWSCSTSCTRSARLSQNIASSGTEFPVFCVQPGVLHRITPVRIQYIHFFIFCPPVRLSFGRRRGESLSAADTEMVLYFAVSKKVYASFSPGRTAAEKNLQMR